MVVADRAFAPSVPALSALVQALARLGHVAILRFVRLDGSVRAPPAMRACAGCACKQALPCAFRAGSVWQTAALLVGSYIAVDMCTLHVVSQHGIQTCSRKHHLALKECAIFMMHFLLFFY